MQAVILDRNKQYIVKIGSFLKIDKMNINIGKIFTFEKVLSIFDDKDITIGNPVINEAKVISKIISHSKGKKKKILKFKRRKGYLRRMGCRQKYTLLQILSIENKLN